MSGRINCPAPDCGESIDVEFEVDPADRSVGIFFDDVRIVSDPVCGACGHVLTEAEIDAANEDLRVHLHEDDREPDWP